MNTRIIRAGWVGIVILGSAIPVACSGQPSGGGVDGGLDSARDGTSVDAPIDASQRDSARRDALGDSSGGDVSDDGAADAGDVRDAHDAGGADVEAGCGALGTTENCHACGDNCAMLPHVTSAVCVSQAAGCGSLVCATGYADCDGIASNGCEADLSSTSTCGTCGDAGQCITPPLGGQTCETSAADAGTDGGYACACDPSSGILITPDDLSINLNGAATCLEGSSQTLPWCFYDNELNGLCLGPVGAQRTSWGCCSNWKTGAYCSTSDGCCFLNSLYPGGVCCQYLDNPDGYDVCTEDPSTEDDSG
jgi:hypothetical protein